MPPPGTQQPAQANRDPGPPQTDISPADVLSHVSPTARTGTQQSTPSGNDSDRYSVHSDDSDIQPSPVILGREKSSSSLKATTSAGPSKSTVTQLSHSLSSDLTPAERSAQELQQALAPPPPDSVNQLSVVAREAIGNVVHYIQTHDNTSPGRYGHDLNDRVLAVVYSVRNLLYVSATPSSQITSNLYPRDTRHTQTIPPSQALQAHLKPAQRKVAGTLSKLVLSTLAVQYEANHAQAADKPMRMEGDAGELDRAVVAFVEEVQRFLDQSAQSSDVDVIKRLYGVFEAEHVGLGLVGAGAGAGWKGFGWLALEGEDEAPNRQLSVEVVAELKGLVAGIDSKRTVLVDTKFDAFGEPGEFLCVITFDWLFSSPLNAPDLQMSSPSVAISSRGYQSPLIISRRFTSRGTSMSMDSTWMLELPRTGSYTFRPSAKLGNSFENWKWPFRRCTMRALRS